MRRLYRVLLALFALFVPLTTRAHEVYVLSPATIAHDIAQKSPNPFLAYRGNELEFFFWGFVTFVGFSTIFFVSIYHRVEHLLDPVLSHLKRYAHAIVRITFGVCFIACGYYAALFGPELPLTFLFGDAAPFVQIALYIIGVCALLGIFTRAAAFLALAILGIAIYDDGIYMLTYFNYLGEIVLLIILGSGSWSLDSLWHRGALRYPFKRFADHARPYAFPVLRICFGISIMFASLYAKFIHSQLAIDTVTQYGLTNYFPFDPLFIVLGALIIEFLIGLLIALGIEIRWTALFFMFWLVLSLLYFKEAVWPHLVLAGLLIAIFCAGYDRYSLEGRYLKREGREPVF